MDTIKYINVNSMDSNLHLKFCCGFNCMGQVFGTKEFWINNDFIYSECRNKRWMVYFVFWSSANWAGIFSGGSFGFERSSSNCAYLEILSFSSNMFTSVFSLGCFFNHSHI